jgi:hypothetical protein
LRKVGEPSLHLSLPDQLVGVGEVNINEAQREFPFCISFLLSLLFSSLLLFWSGLVSSDLLTIRSSSNRPLNLSSQRADPTAFADPVPD